MTTLVSHIGTPGGSPGDGPGGGLTYDQAAASPCEGCTTAQCCTHMPLQMLQVTDLPQLDYMGYLLGFDAIEIGYGQDGLWRIFYRMPCGFLDPEDGSCRVYRTPRQPNVCIAYDPYRCWYRKGLSGDGTAEYFRLDMPRLELLRSRMVFDDDRRLVAMPAWGALAEEMATLPYGGAEPVGGPAGRPLAEQLGEPAGEPVGGESALRVFRDLHEPCHGCSAHCCRSLLFPQPQPTSAAQLDQMRFYLGFPGVELILGEDAWTLVVHTTCRHLEGDRCALYGQPERPLYCTLFDAWGCSYKALLGTPPAEGAPRVDRERFETVLDLFTFDTQMAITRFPAYAEIRQAAAAAPGAA